MITAEVEVSEHDGPVVRVKVLGTAVSVYLAAETAVVTSVNGEYGVEVSGHWPGFKEAIGMTANNDNMKGEGKWNC